MLRLLDARTGERAEVTPARPGLLLVCAHVLTDDAGLDLSAARVLLVADLLARTAEMRGLQAMTFVFDGGEPAGHALREGAHPQPSRGIAGTAWSQAGERHGDPLAVRLALMALPYHEPAAITPDELPAASRTLVLWRHRVAAWAESPSRPMPARTAAAFREAFELLDTGRVLAVLRDLAPDGAAQDSQAVPAGARFETFVYADRILGLDLARDIGQARG